VNTVNRASYREGPYEAGVSGKVVPPRPDLGDCQFTVLLFKLSFK